MIKAVGNTELCELLDVEPKAQCKACLAYWDVGIVHCTCGHFLRDDTTENKKYIKSVLDLFSIPNFYIRKGRPHGHRYGKKEGDYEYFVAKSLKKKCNYKDFLNVHARFIRDTWFRKTTELVFVLVQSQAPYILPSVSTYLLCQQRRHLLVKSMYSHHCFLQDATVGSSLPPCVFTLLLAVLTFTVV